MFQEQSRVATQHNLILKLNEPIKSSSFRHCVMISLTYLNVPTLVCKAVQMIAITGALTASLL